MAAFLCRHQISQSRRLLSVALNSSVRTLLSSRLHFDLAFISPFNPCPKCRVSLKFAQVGSMNLTDFSVLHASVYRLIMIQSVFCVPFIEFGSNSVHAFATRQCFTPEIPPVAEAIVLH